MKLEDKLFTLKTKADEGHPHIHIKDTYVCIRCPGKYCMYYCPAGVYKWDEEQKKIIVSWENCIECGAATYGCPYNNIIAYAPRGGFGVQYRYG